MKPLRWSVEAEKYLREQWPAGVSAAEIGAHLGRSAEAVKSRATILRLKRAISKHSWTALENRYICMYYPRGDVKAMAARLGVSVMRLYQHARTIGAQRDPQTVLETNRKLAKALAEKGLGYRFQKGHVSHNKGKKQSEFLTPEQMERARANCFQKGNIPHNHKPIGYERVSKDGYVEVKVRDAEDSTFNFEFKHRIVWEKHNGPIPDGCIIEFCDGDNRNFEPANLRCVTRKENVERNTFSDKGIVKRFMRVKDTELVETIITKHPHLVELKRSEILLKRKLNEISRKDK